MAVYFRSVYFAFLVFFPMLPLNISQLMLKEPAFLQFFLAWKDFPVFLCLIDSPSHLKIFAENTSFSPCMTLIIFISLCCYFST